MLAVAWLQAPRLGDEFRVDEDFRSFYWMNKFQESDLFPEYFFRYTMVSLPWADIPVRLVSLGYTFLYYIGSFLMPPVLFSKLLPFIIMPVTALYLYKFGLSARDRNTGVALALGFLFFNLASSSAISITNGLQRSFATTLTILLIYYLHHKNYLIAAGTLLLSVLIYPPMFALGLTIWGILLLRTWYLERGIRLSAGGLGHLLAGMTFGVIILLPAFPSIAVHLQPQRTIVANEQKTGEEADTVEAFEYLWQNPTFKTGGKSPLFIVFPIIGRGGLVDLGEDIINLLILLVMGGLIFLVGGRKVFSVPPILWDMFWATIILFILSWVVIALTNSFLLYLPSRYTRVGLFLFLLMFVFLNILDFVREAPKQIQRHPRRVFWLIGAVGVAILGLIIWYPSELASINGFNIKWLLVLAGACLGILGVMIMRKRQLAPPSEFRLSQTAGGRVLIASFIGITVIGWAVFAPILTEVSYLNPSEPERSLFLFLRTLPKDAWIAGSPCILDSVSLFAKRQILFSCEHMSSSGDVISEALGAYYTDDSQVIIDFCQAHNIDYLVVDLMTYSDKLLNGGQLFFEPFNQALLANIAGQETFVLNDVPDEIKIFQAQDFYVVPCDKLQKLN